jgi:hypothetical protein
MKRKRQSKQRQQTKRRSPRILELDTNEREQLQERIEAKELNVEDYKIFKALLITHAYLTELVDDTNLTIARLRKLLFGARIKKTETGIGSRTDSDTPSPCAENPGTQSFPKTAPENDP